jgi:arabinan endo-1,5-alpha-L-arabinosidase
LVLLLLATTCALAQRSPSIIQPAGDVEHTHDPSIIKDGDTWYVFGTNNGPERTGELPIRCSTDLKHWQRCGYVFPGIPEWIRKESPETKELWAPDISYFNGEYHLYYAFSAFGKNTSGIALATNKTLDPKSPNFRWVDRGLVLRSRVEDDFNAIDPNLVIDDKGLAWLSFGSFWSGIKMRRIDPKSGLLSTEDSKLYSLASRKRPPNPPPSPPGLPGNWQAIEAPFIVRHADYYYLFVSFDLCCRGTKSNYKTMVGRSHNVTGPYIDAAGTPMLEGGGTPLLVGNARWIGPGGESVLQQKDGDLIVYHAYDGKTG